MLSLAEWLRTPLQSVPFAPQSATFWKDQADGSLLNSQWAIAGSRQGLAGPLAPGDQADGLEQACERVRVARDHRLNLGFTFALEDEHRAGRCFEVRVEHRAGDLQPAVEALEIVEMRRTLRQALVQAAWLVVAGGDEQHRRSSGLSTSQPQAAPKCKTPRSLLALLRAAE